MKRMYFIIALIGLFSLTIRAQDELIFEKVIQADSLSKDELFVLVNDWFATTFVSANHVIQMADKEAGVLIGKGLFFYTYGKYAYTCFDGDVRFMVKATIKDNRFKIEVSSFIHSNKQGYAPSCNLGLITNQYLYAASGINKNYQNTVWQDIKALAKEKSENFFSEMEAKVKLKIEKTDDNW